jgi:uncharacterized protein (TIGR03663 family)
MNAPEVSARAWWIASISIFVVAAILRLYDLDLKPLHHDEGVNGFFLIRLFREGFYEYDPANYHGPSLYYFALLSVILSGLTTFAIRFVPVLFGLGTVWLALCLRRYLGAIGALSAAALIAVSPGAVYLSRYFIHESLFVFFTFGIVVAVLRYMDEAQPLYLMLASLWAALLFATKETAIISVGVLAIASVSTAIYMMLRKGEVTASWEKRPAMPGSHATRSSSNSSAMGADETPVLLDDWTNRLLMALTMIAVFVLVNILLYSSFFTHTKGIRDAIGTFKFWTATGTSAHVHAWYTYLQWLWMEEAPVLVLGVAGIVLAAWRADNRFTVFAALWAFGITAAYSLVPYKTPWLTLNLIIPLAIIGGYAVSLIYRLGKSLGARIVALVLTLGVALVICGYQTVTLNFYHYDDDKYPYVYAHTYRDFLLLVNEVKRLAKRAGTGEETSIVVTSPDYWPLPWYLRDYKHVGYHSRIQLSGEAIVVGSSAQELELQAALGSNYQRVDSYRLRPGVILVIYVRRDVNGP